MTDIKTEYHILSLGAGVQSTMLALLSHRQDAPKYVPKFDCAIFADTQEEPAAVYRHLEWLTAEVAPSFPVIVATAGKLGDDLLSGRRPEGNGTSYDMPGRNRFATIPAFTTNTEGVPGGITRRQCSKEYKTDVIEKTIRRTVLGIPKGGRVPKGIMVHMYVGLSADEGKRIHGRNGKPGVKARIESKQWQRAHFPLYDLLLLRMTCENWLETRVPHKVPRSACSFCPFHSDKEWVEIRDNDPEAWQRCLEIDEAIRKGPFAICETEQKLYLHSSCVPLKDADFSVTAETARQGELNFSVLECEGMCGL